MSKAYYSHRDVLKEKVLLSKRLAKKSKAYSHRDELKEKVLLSKRLAKKEQSLLTQRCAKRESITL